MGGNSGSQGTDAGPPRHQGRRDPGWDPGMEAAGVVRASQTQNDSLCLYGLVASITLSSRSGPSSSFLPRHRALCVMSRRF